MEAKLIVVGGKANKEVIVLKLPALIGRSRQAELTVAHPMISRRHCELFEVEGLLMIRDLDSLNGTVVRGQRVSEAALRPDDEFSVGPLTFRAEYEYHGDLEAVPPPKLLEPQAQRPAAESDREVADFSAPGQTPTFGFPAATDDRPVEQPEVEQLPDFFATVKPDAKQPLSTETGDEDLDEFLEGLP